MYLVVYLLDSYDYQTSNKFWDDSPTTNLVGQLWLLNYKLVPVFYLWDSYDSQTSNSYDWPTSDWTQYPNCGTGLSNY